MLPLQIQRYLPDQQELLPVPLVNFIYHFVPHIIYSLWICTFAITKFISKMMHNQIQYWYILTQVVSGWVMPSDIDGDCQLKLACLVSDTVKLIIIIILQVRDSTSSRRSQEWISPRLLALVANCVNACNAHLHRRMTRKSTCDLLLCSSRSISHKAHDPKSTGHRQLLIVSPVIPGVMAIFTIKKMTSMHLKN